MAQFQTHSAEGCKMFKLILFSLLSILITTQVVSCVSVVGKHASFKDSTNWETLDDAGLVKLGWTVDTESELITFEIYAETRGYVGFGISPNGDMTGADIFIAGVFDDGEIYYSDRFGLGHMEPKIDEHEDWVLHEAEEGYNSTYNGTYLRFSRLLNTCDEEDYPIGVDTTRLIWAMGDSDDINYHTSARRGTRSVNLLKAPMPEVDFGSMLEYQASLDMEMPADQTAYWCSFHRGPELAKKHHVVAFDAFLPSALALAHTHHFILHNCYKDPSDDASMEDIFGNYTVDKGYKGNYCYEPINEDPNNPVNLMEYCQEFLYVWAKGGKTMVFPENVGYPIGGEEQVDPSMFYMLEIHYDNPDKLVGQKFETGVKFYYTDEPREIDAGQIMIGHRTSTAITIPPNTEEFVVVGHCGSECTSKFPEDGIQIFNSLLHSHLSGRKLKLRQFRDGVELPWPDYDNHYDFDYQQNKHLSQPITVLKGDHISYECTYDSNWKNGQVVIGALSTRDEMCEAFLWYYPKMEIEVCVSSYDESKGLEDLGITKYERVQQFGQPSKLYIIEPEYLAGDYQESLSTKFNWTEENKRELQEKRRYSEHKEMCHSRKSVARPTFQVGYPAIKENYQPDDSVCQVSDTSSSLTDASSSITDASSSTTDASSSTTDASVTDSSPTTLSDSSSETTPSSGFSLNSYTSMNILSIGIVAAQILCINQV